MSKKEKQQYDKVMRGNLIKPSTGLIRKLLSIGGIKMPDAVQKIEVTPVPPRVQLTIAEKEVDTVVIVKIENSRPFILHIEFQSANDPRMARRMAAYDYWLYLEYDLRVIGIVIYIGKKKMNIKNYCDLNGNRYLFGVFDIRELDPELFLCSENPREIILSILAKYQDTEKELLINKILNKLQQVNKSETELGENVKRLEILSNLRDKEIQQLIIEKIKAMPIIYDIRKDLRYKEGKKDGITLGQKEGLEAGRKEGMYIAMEERNKAFVGYLLQHTNHSVEEIAKLVNVPIEFVEKHVRDRNVI